MVWSVAGSPAWVLSELVTGSSPLAPEAHSGEITVAVNTWGLPAGSHTGTVTISSQNETAAVGLWVVLTPRGRGAMVTLR
jgi:hypothetical protein